MERNHRDANACRTGHIAEASRSMVTEDVAYRMADLFAILSDQTRLRIISVLIDRELCVYDISSLVGLGQSAVSHQLRALRGARLVKRRREGQRMFYSLDDDHIKHLFSESLDHLREDDEVLA